MNQPYLSQLFVYPVKSLAGFEVENWQVGEKGLLYDRKWMLVNDKGRFLSQRHLPKMALIKTAIRNESLILSAADRENLVLELNPKTEESVKTQIWNDICVGHKVSKQADEWLSDFLNISCSLVYQANETTRVVDPNYAKSTDKVYFSDGFPFLLLSKASLHHLNQEIGEELSVLRFRPNIVIAGCKAYAEDTWREIKIGSIDFRLPKPCSRCTVPAINPETAKIHPDLLKKLKQLRSWQNKVYFGQNALHNNFGLLKKNDILTIKKSSLPQPYLTLKS